jgi:hypothetical protein
MKLAELEPQFLAIQDERTRRHVDTLGEAQGVMFLCPKCFETNGGSVGTHSVLCWFRDRGVPDDVDPRPGRWGTSGTGIADLSLSPSVQLQGGCDWHGWVTNGEVTS